MDAVKPNLPFSQVPQGAVPPPLSVPEPVLETTTPTPTPTPPLPTTPLPSVEEPLVTAQAQSLSENEGMIVPQKKTKSKGVGAKNLVLVAVLVLMLGGLVAGFGKVRSFLTSAQGGCNPEGLTEANLTAGSIEIVFQTSKACQMEIAYGTSSEALLLQVPEAMASLNHRIRLAPLLPSTTYYYQVVSEGKRVGQVRSFLTKAPEVTPTQMPVEEPPEVIPGETVVPEATASGKYTLQDFQSQFGGDNPEFDLDKNGIVNMRDWLMYQKQ